MKFNYQDHGSVATLIITSTIFEFRKHNRIVDTTLFLVPGVVSERRGAFLMKTFISGKPRDALRAYRVVVKEAAR